MKLKVSKCYYILHMQGEENADSMFIYFVT